MDRWHIGRGRIIVPGGSDEGLKWPDEMVQAYSRWLEIKSPGHLKAFTARLGSDPEGAHAEATVFSAVRGNVTLDITVGETPGEGGADFHCKTPDGEFLLEVTHIPTKTLSEKSGIEEEVEIVGGAEMRTQSFTLQTDFAYRIAQKKAAQVSGAAMPVVVAVVSEHRAANVLLGTMAASELMCSGSTYRIPINASEVMGGPVMKHPNAPFYSVGKSGVITAERQSISAMLLIALSPWQIAITGLLHPDPVHPLSIAYFPKVPFRRIANWPCSARQISLEWLIHDPEPAIMNCPLVSLSDEEYRSRS